MKCVFDTNVLISALLFPGSTPHNALRMALEFGSVYTSEECFEELHTRLSPGKFDKYFQNSEREQLIDLTKNQLEFIIITKHAEGSRDKSDNKFLSVSEAIEADYLVTGDGDLLSLISYRTTSILRAAEFIAIKQ